jgi:hypothetical protein
MKNILTLIKGLFKQKPLPINHPKYLKKIAKVIKHIEDVEGVLWGKGRRSDAFLSLEAKCMITPIKLVDEFMLIHKSKSALPLRERRLVIAIVAMGISGKKPLKIKK